MTPLPRWTALFWNRRILRGLVLLASFACPVVGPSAVSTWARWEHSLTSDKSYANAAAAARLKVSFRGPNQQTISGLGFWDGGILFIAPLLMARLRGLA